MSIKKYINKTIEIFKSIFLFLKKIFEWIKEKLTTPINKEQNDEDFSQTNKLTTKRIYKNIKKIWTNISCFRANFIANTNYRFCF